MKRDFQVRFLKAMSLSAEHFLLDIGCGTLRGGTPLIEYLQEGHYFGVEVREEVLDEGRKELQEAGLEGNNPTLLLAPDISRLTIDQTFGYIWAFSVIIHMADEILDGAREQVEKIFNVYSKDDKKMLGVRYWFWNLVATRTINKMVEAGKLNRIGNGQYRFLLKA